jgi:hypothetical protein
MKKIITTIIAAAAVSTAQADLAPKAFEQLTDWAVARGFFYERVDLVGKSKTKCFVFNNREKGSKAFVPASSDTADEAINALIASSATIEAAAEQSAIPAHVVKQPEMIGFVDFSDGTASENGETETLAQENAVKMAQDYLEHQSFSRRGLIQQLIYEGFSRKDAIYAVDQIGL